MKHSKTFHLLFFLKKGKESSDSANIYLRITLDGVRTESSLYRKCSLSSWNAHAGRSSGRNEQAKSLNAYLDTVELRFHEIFRNLMAEGVEVTGELLKAKFWGRDTEKPRMLLEIFEAHNQQFRELVGKEFSIGTFKRFQVCKKSLVEFLQCKYSAQDIDIRKLNFEFIQDYEFYLKTVRKCSHNTVMGYLKKLKKIIRQCISRDWLEKDPFLAHKVSYHETHRTILNEQELQAISNKLLPISRLSQVRDLFLFSCYTGLSYSDIVKLTPADITVGIDGQKWIFTTRTKTGTVMRVPLLPPALDILKAYQGHPITAITEYVLPIISNQKLNSYLKELADLCGINKELTFHCARHTFATTVTLSNGVPIETVSKMLGHKSLRTTQLYAKILDHKISQDMEIIRKKYALRS